MVLTRAAGAAGGEAAAGGRGGLDEAVLEDGRQGNEAEPVGQAFGVEAVVGDEGGEEGAERGEQGSGESDAEAAFERLARCDVAAGDEVDDGGGDAEAREGEGEGDGGLIEDGDAAALWAEGPREEHGGDEEDGGAGDGAEEDEVDAPD